MVRKTSVNSSGGATSRLLNVDDLSRLTGWSPLTVYKKSAAGEIPGRVKLGKHSLRFREAEVESWIQNLEKAG